MGLEKATEVASVPAGTSDTNLEMMNHGPEREEEGRTLMANFTVSSVQQGRPLCSRKQNQHGVSVPAFMHKLLFNIWSRKNVNSKET